MQETGYLSQTSAAGLSSFCAWEIPARKTSVSMRLSIVDWLGAEIRSRSADLQQGGILLGRMEDGEARHFAIEGFVPLPAAVDGKLWGSPEDPKANETLVHWGRGAGKNLYSIGLYRSHARDSFENDTEDAQVAARLFPGIPSLLLLVRTEGFESKAALSVIDGGSPCTQPDLVFPLKRQTLTAGEATRCTRETRLPESTVVQHRVLPAERGPEQLLPRVPPAPAFRRTWVVASLILAASMLTSAWLIASRWLAAPPPPLIVERPRGLELRTETDGPYLVVAWNRDASIIAGATGGILSISDSVRRRDLELDAVQLRSGRYSFRFSGLAPAVSLHVLAGERQAVESIGRGGILQAAPEIFKLPESRTAPPLALNSPPRPAANFQPPGANRLKRSAQQAKAPPQKPAAKPSTITRAAAKSPPSGRSLRTPPPRSGNPKPESLAKTAVRSGPERVSAAMTPASGGAAPTAVVKPALPPPAQDFAGHEPRSSPTFPPAVPAGNPSVAPSSVDYFPPLPIHRVIPDFPQDMKHWVGAGIVINVRVFVNNLGRVVRAEPLVRGGPQLERLSVIAVNAAMEWDFAPARRDGRAVDGEAVVTFRFAPQE
jgi:hypothetical protein